MALRDKWMVSVDDHIVEPPHLWETWLPKSLRDEGPKYVRDEDGEGWVYAGRKAPYQQLIAAAGKDSDELSPFPISMEDMRPGCYEPKARVEDMDRNQVMTSVVFPTFSGLFGNTFFEYGDLEVGKACISAYNDFLLQEWSASQPGRFAPIILVPFWDMEASVKEVERCIPLGAKAIGFTQNPTHVVRMENGQARTLPSIHDRKRYWDPLFSIANETSIPFCIHIASSTVRNRTAPDAPSHISGCTARTVDPSLTTFDWLFSGNLQRFPNLKILLSEGGVGWIPTVLESADYQAWRHGSTTDRLGDYDPSKKGSFDAAKPEHMLKADENASFRNGLNKAGLKPSDLFRRQMFGCYFRNEPALRHIEEIGVENVMIEVDYPHSDSTWPKSMELAEATLADKSEEIQDKVMFGNAMKVFNLEAPKALADIYQGRRATALADA